MRVAFESLTGSARVYYYPSSRKLYPEEVPTLREKAESFCDSLSGTEIAYRLEHDRFLIFFVSDKAPLSIEQNDQLVQFVLELEKEHGVTLLDKVNVCFKQGKFVQRKEIKEFKQLLKKRSVSPKTVVFDPMINTKNEFLSNWEVPLSESWLSHLV